MKASESSPYEVRCRECKVSFPLGTRVCVHCGARLGKRRAARVPDVPVPLEIEYEPDTELEPPRRGVLGSFFTTVTVGLAILASLYRSCG